MKKTKILIVEDQLIIAEDIQLILEKLGYAVSSIVHSGKEAIKKAKEDRPDLILMDIILQNKMDGIEAAEKIYSSFKIPIVYVTAYGDEETIERAKLTKPFGYIFKPFEERELYSNIEMALYKSRMNKILMHSNNMLQILCNINRLIYKEKDRGHMLQSVCNTLIKDNVFHNSWIALFDDSGKLITTFEAGLGKDFLPMVERLKLGKFPETIQKTLSQPGVVVNKDPVATCTDCPLAKKYSGRSGMSVRLEYMGKVYGLLVASTISEFNKEKEEKLLFQEIAEDISFAQYNIDLEEERKATEEKIQYQNEFLELIIDSLTHPFYVIDANNYTVTLANTAARIGDLSKNPTCYTSTHKQKQPCEADQVCPLEEVKKTKEPVIVEHTHYDKDGNVRIVEIHGYPIFNSKGKVVQMIEYCLDITKRKHAVADLERERNHLRTLIDNLPDFIYFKDTESRFVTANKAVAKFMGASNPDELIGKRDFDYYPKELAEVFFSDEKKVMQSGKAIIQREESSIDSKGKSIWLSTTKVPLRDGEGKVVGTVGMGRDITERINVEAALKRSELELRKQKEALEQKNIALREIIGQVEIEKNMIKDNVRASIDKMLIPIAEKIKISGASEEYVELLKHGLDKINSSFSRKITDNIYKLTPREIEISHMIENGHTNKEISKILIVSIQTIENHRKNIRKKLNLTNKKANLASFLQRLSV